MTKNIKTEIRGNKNNPWHKSVGAVIQDDFSKVLLIQKSNGMYTLLRETQYLEESPLNCIKRGAQEELGLNIEIEKYLGTLLAEFLGKDGSTIFKSTDYFLAKQSGEIEKGLQADEIDDVYKWFTVEKALKILETQGEFDKKANEAEILKRL